MVLHDFVKEREAAQAVQKMPLRWRLVATAVIMARLAGLAGVIYGVVIMMGGLK